MRERWRLRPDRMSVEERIEALLRGQAIDHVGFYPFARVFCARNTGIPLVTSLLDA